MAINSDEVYEVGYGKPPRERQFKKGVSGNPKGRPAGSRNLTTLVLEELTRSVIITENGHRRTISKRQAIAKQITNRAVGGDFKAVKLLIELLRAESGAISQDDHAGQDRADQWLENLSPEVQRILLEELKKSGQG